ncbi:DUF4197 domain-containing protein [Pedobacter sp. SYSU D00535]|uniref:DUF4197 domain-containing protein n=1 Tax=Pedobacter sp. SYSU D00535 TaxID=2810308 RepID=UPI001A97915B|nr:DUF4197 domain-containing protein [Pedobacter sp. SYSU D00535]
MTQVNHRVNRVEKYTLQVRPLALIVLAIIFNTNVQAQTLKNLVKKNLGKDSSLVKTVKASGVLQPSSLSLAEITSGLKEALNKGVEKGTGRLSMTDGFFKREAVKILMPEEARKIESTLRSAGMGKLVDDAILTMNRAAEDAAKGASPIFLSAIKNMSIADAKAILSGPDTAATGYLRKQTSASLVAAFKPLIQQSLDKVNATKNWNTMITAYNKIPLVKKQNPDLAAFVTGKAISGVFYEIAAEEILIRKDPLARTSDLLKKVFGR